MWEVRCGQTHKEGERGWLVFTYKQNTFISFMKAANAVAHTMRVDEEIYPPPHAPIMNTLTPILELLHV